MDKLIDEMLASLGEHGYQARAISISHLHQLQEEIEDLRRHALLDSQFDKDRLSWFSFQVPRTPAQSTTRTHRERK